MQNKSDRVKKETNFWNSEEARNHIGDTELDLDICLSNILKAFPNNPKRILEIGCGIGRLTIPIAKKYPNAKVFGVDISETLIKYGISQAEKEKIKNVFFHVNDGRELPSLPKIDIAYSMITFQHISEDGVRYYIDQIAKLLNKGGIFRFQFVEGVDHAEFSQQYDRKIVEKWCEDAGLKLLSEEDDTNSFPEATQKPEWVWLTLRKK